MQFRSQFLAAASLYSLLHAARKFIKPKLDLEKPDFSPCWRWQGLVTKTRPRIKKLRRKSITYGERWDLFRQQEPTRPLLYIGTLGAIDARRLVFEIFYPEAGLTNYRLYRLDTCYHTDCVNPHHFAQKIIPVSPFQDYPVYLNQQGVFSAHLIGSYHPHNTNIADTPLPPLESPKKGQQIEMLKNQEVTELSQFGTGFGKPIAYNEFAENVALIPYNVKAEWQAFTAQFLHNSSPEIQNWITKWSNFIPDSPTINHFSPDCVGEAYAELREQNPEAESFLLSNILAIDHFWFHPRLVIIWYRNLPATEQGKILTNQ